MGHTHLFWCHPVWNHVDVLLPEVQVPLTKARFMEKGSYLKKGVQSNIERFMVTGSNLRRSKSHQIRNDAWRRAPSNMMSRTPTAKKRQSERTCQRPGPSGHTSFRGMEPPKYRSTRLVSNPSVNKVVHLRTAATFVMVPALRLPAVRPPRLEVCSKHR